MDRRHAPRSEGWVREVRKLLDLTRALAKDNPGQEFFVDVEKVVSGAKNPETGEIIPILSGLSDGNVAAYHGVLVDGKTPEFAWRALTDHGFCG